MLHAWACCEFSQAQPQNFSLPSAWTAPSLTSSLADRRRCGRSSEGGTLSIVRPFTARAKRAVATAAVTTIMVLAGGTVSTASTTAFSFNGSASEPSWLAVNDGVMGGVSTGRVTVEKGIFKFTGRVRLENNGGFASARSTGVPTAANSALAGGNVVSLRVRGSGVKFVVTVQTADGWFWAPVAPPKNQWTTVDIAFADFLPHTRFGEIVDGDPYAGQPTSAIGILVGNKRAERFSIEIDSISILQR